MFFRRWFRKPGQVLTDEDPEKAYDRWAITYDQQPGNLMLDLDEAIFAGLLNNITAENKTVIDYGCGTGRQWEAILNRKPGKLIGYDVSKGMLSRLKDKFQGAEVYQLKDGQMPEQASSSAGLLVSTLTLAHIDDPVHVFDEWNRVLQAGGDIIITDYHPDILAKGGKRTFSDKGKIVSVKNHIHPLAYIRDLAGQLGWKEIRLTEKILDDSMKGYYEKKNAVSVFEKFRGLPLIYGIHFKKA